MQLNRRNPRLQPVPTWVMEGLFLGTEFRGILQD